MAVPNTRERAKQLVQQIAKNHGYLGEEKLRPIEPELRREIEEALLKKDELIGSNVITLAKNLYTSKARFVFELLQNADDNNYTKAEASDTAPYVSFCVSPQQITMECNEDGFTDENLEAICSVGKSSKTGSQGYIGEKGIGFKSVFMAAWKVHIQSGAFSFSFSHRNGESGMGMVSPIWEDVQEDQELPLTRLTLHLHDIGDSSALEKTRQTIREQFQELQETILLFMKNLRMIQVSFVDIDGAETSSVVYSIERPELEVNRAVLTRTVIENGTKQESIKHYHVTDHQATDVPRHETRTSSGQAEQTSQIVLAFPLSETSDPVIEPQDIFVYLPVRPVGFNFVIQADFVTDASRQDIVKDSLRNIALLDGVADAFSRAVLQFCEHDRLRLQWVRYLPDRNDRNWGSLWLDLVEKIANRLSQTPVLYCHKKFDRHLIADLVLPGTDVRVNGEPLFEDGDPEDIVSHRYEEDDLNILRDYGLKVADFGYIVRWLATDLARGTQSRMRSATTTASWHTQAAKLLHRPFSQGWNNTKAQLKAMALLPLKGGSWVSVNTGPVYFGSVDGIDIPPNLGLRIIDKTITNTHRRRLFKDLGVQKATVSLVRSKILEMYEQPGFLSDLSVQISKEHLTFLYLTQHLESTDETDYSEVVLFDQGESKRKPFEKYMYMATEKSPYSPWELLKGGGSLSGPGCDAPGFMGHYFVNEGYFLDPPQTPPNQALTWVEWFYNHLDIESYVALLHFQDEDMYLSDAGQYLQEHRPERFLGALRIHHYHKSRPSSENIARLQEIPVLCRGKQMMLLKDTYFPTERLEDLAERFVESDGLFPWLWIDPQIPEDTISASWDKLLNDFKNGVPLDDLGFALDMLKYSVRSLRNDCSSGSENKLFSLYIYVESQYLGGTRRDTARSQIRKLFADTEAIYIPFADSNTWASPDSCVWGATRELRTKFVLEKLYEPWLSNNPDSREDLKRFFCVTLGISDCTSDIYVDELKSIRDSGSEDSDIINSVYEALHSLWDSTIAKDVNRNWLKAQFEKHALIYAVSDEGPSWRKTSQCVWSTAARLRDMVSLNDEYEKLHDFFVDVLGVRPVDLKMAIDELKEAGNRQSVNVEEVKASLLTVNSLLRSEPDQQQQAELTEARIFPVKYPRGEARCVSAGTQFFVVDLELLRSPFENHVKLLDFNLEEVVRLQYFFKWVGIENRYISRSVRQSTSVQKTGAQPRPELDRHFRQRAHALLRIAKHFESPRAMNMSDEGDLYQILRNAKIFSTNAISLELSLSQDGVRFEALGGSLNMHLHENGPNLEIYLPRKKSDQQHSFSKHLPERILQWLMTDKDSQFTHETSDKAVMNIKDVWNAPLEKLLTTLDECGIIPISTSNLDAYSEELSSDTGPDDSDDSETVDTSTSAQDTIPQNHADTYSGSSSSESFTSDGTENESNILPIRLAEQSRPATPLEEFLNRDTHYISLLGRVIASARVSSIPDRNEHHPNTAWRGSSNIYGSDKFERDCKVGAAGELFVFELLSHLTPALPNFSRTNWQSKMRRCVTVHPDYADMSPWTEPETSDITYTDTQGVLTDLLVRNHYLDEDRWTGRTPHYFIEVKTTTSSCDAPFYMSDGQYQRMRDVTLSEGNNSEIYVVFRVYQLDRSDQGPRLRIYVDPESLRLSRVLDFTAPTWLVTPGEN